MQRELYGTRDLTYSQWHRRDSLQRYIGYEAAQDMYMCDVDSIVFVEYRKGDGEILAILETAKDVGQKDKSAFITKRLAQRAGIYGYIVLYTPSSIPGDIDKFRVKQLWPQEDHIWHSLSPKEWANKILNLRFSLPEIQINQYKMFKEVLP